MILPLRMQRVQARMRRVAPLMSARMVCRFGRKTRLVRLLAWLTLLPTARAFPQISHALATVVLLPVVQAEAHATTTSLSLTSDAGT